MELGIITALLAVTLYILVVFLLWRTGVLERLRISAAGPLLMIRTRRGLRLLDRLARHDRFFRLYGSFALGMTLFFMAVVSLILIWEVPLALRLPASAVPGPEMIIGIPGINPLIPLGYGVLALAIAIVFHEVAHGVLARVARVTVKSAGLLLFLIPIGAFVEPDDDQLNAAPKRKRLRMYAVGPATNLLLCFLCAAIFSWGFMASVQPVEDGAVVTNVVKDYPAFEAGLVPWCLITSVEVPNLTGTDPTVASEEDFSKIMSQTRAGDNITITYVYRGERRTTHAVLADKYEYYQEYYNESNREEYRGRGFLGIGTMSADLLPRTLAHPLRADSVERFVATAAYYVGLPFFGVLPLEHPITDLYTVTGPLAVLGPDAFWVLTNCFYWLFWLNLMLGATNALPIPRLDGGMVFKDVLDSLYRRLRPAWSGEVREKKVLLTYRLTGVFIVFLILWQFIGPRVGGMF